MCPYIYIYMYNYIYTHFLKTKKQNIQNTAAQVWEEMTRISADFQQFSSRLLFHISPFPHHHPAPYLEFELWVPQHLRLRISNVSMFFLLNNCIQLPWSGGLKLGDPKFIQNQRIQRLIMIYPLNHCKFGIPFQLGNDYSKSIGCHLSGVMTTG